MRQAAQRHVVGIALPDHVDMAHAEVDRLAVAHLAADVVQHAIAHVDRVVQPEQPARRAVLGREIGEHVLPPGAGVRVVASRRDRRCFLGGAAAAYWHERINAACREGHDPRGLEDLRNHRRDVHVHRPGERHIARGTELAAGHEHDVGHLGQLLERGAVEQVGRQRLDACLLQLPAHALLAEARHADHALGRRGALGHACQGRPHLAADAQHHDVARCPRQIGGQCLGRPRHEFFERLDRVETLGQLHVH